MINDYPELIAEVSARSGVSDVASRARMHVGMAEKMLSRRLRLSGMETAVTLTTDAEGSVGLPDDFQEMRIVRTSKRELTRQPVGMVLYGRATGYFVHGKTLKSSYNSAPHDCLYYAAIPGLEENNTNWLLADEPEIYLQSVLLQVYVSQCDVDKAQTISGYLDGLIATAQQADHMKRHAGTRINLGRVAP